MVVSIAAMLIYNYRFSDAAERFDPAVFGVAVSCLTWFVLGALAALPIPFLRSALKADQAG